MVDLIAKKGISMFETVSYGNVLDKIGNTPLVWLPIQSDALILAKLEYLNPGGSIKDRPALFMIEDAEKRGLLKPGSTIIEASSGNQGIALAMIGAFKGYNVIITVPDKTSDEKVATLRSYGAEVVMCPSCKDPQDPRGFHMKAAELNKQIEHSFMPNQYYNKQNPRAHYSTTGPEIWEQTQGAVTHFIAAKGSCGTISGTGTFLKEKNPAIKVIAVDELPAEDLRYKIEGIGIGIDDNLDDGVVDETILVAGKNAYKQVNRFAAQYGMLPGLSSGAVIHATLDLLDKFKPGDVVVTIFADSGRAYLHKLAQ